MKITLLLCCLFILIFWLLPRPLPHPPPHSRRLTCINNSLIPRHYDLGMRLTCYAKIKLLMLVITCTKNSIQHAGFDCLLQWYSVLVAVCTATIYGYVHTIAELLFLVLFFGSHHHGNSFPPHCLPHKDSLEAQFTKTEKMATKYVISFKRSNIP